MLTILILPNKIPFGLANWGGGYNYGHKRDLTQLWSDHDGQKIYRGPPWHQLWAYIMTIIYATGHLEFVYSYGHTTQLWTWPT